MTPELTPLGLQDAIIEDLKELFDGYLYKYPHDPEEEEPTDDSEEDSEDTDSEVVLTDDHSPSSDYEKRKKLNIYPQDTPINQTETGEEIDPCPYIIVRLNSGEDDGSRDSDNTVNVILIIGLWDDAVDGQGYRDVMGIINKIYIRYHKDPMLKKQFMYAGNFKWKLQEDNYFPYFFAACNLDFYIPAVRRENAFT
jgi:hypothetical protein